MGFRRVVMWYRPNFEIQLKRANIPYHIDDSKCTKDWAALEKLLHYPLSDDLKAFVSHIRSVKIEDYQIALEPSQGEVKGIVVCRHEGIVYLYQADGKIRPYSEGAPAQYVFRSFYFQ